MSNGPEFLTTSRAAEFLCVTTATLWRWRTKGIGPAVYKLIDARNGAIRYRRTALEAWLTEREQPKPKKRGRPKGSKNRPALGRLKADLCRVMMEYPLAAPDLRVVMGAFGVERLRDLPVDQHPDFVAALIALGERYQERDAE